MLFILAYIQITIYFCAYVNYDGWDEKSFFKEFLLKNELVKNPQLTKALHTLTQFLSMLI